MTVWMISVDYLHSDPETLLSISDGAWDFGFGNIHWIGFIVPPNETLSIQFLFFVNPTNYIFLTPACFFLALLNFTLRTF